MNEEIEIKERILSESEQLFNRFGYTKVTMQEIADSMGMSKKTVYKFFEGKEQIVKEIIYQSKCKIDDYIEEVWSNSNMEYVEKLATVMKFIKNQMPMMRGPLLEDLKKNVPQVFEEFQEVRKKSIREKCTRMVREGISKGAVRKDLDENVIMFMYVTSVQNILVPEVLSEIPLTTEQVFENIISILFKGVFTEEGRIKYQKFLEDDEKEKQNFNSSLNSN